MLEIAALAPWPGSIRCLIPPFAWGDCYLMRLALPRIARAVWARGSVL